MAAEDYETALKYLDKAILSSEVDITYYYAKAAMLHNMCDQRNLPPNKHNEIEKLSIKYYEKVISVNSHHEDALYNLGIIYYNKAVKITMKANDIPFNEDDRYKIEMNKAREIFKFALPYFEKSYLLNKKDRNIQEALRTIYLKLRLTKQSQAIKKIIGGQEDIEIETVSNLETLTYND